MSENEKSVPKRRFREFENADDWEQRNLEEVYKKIRNAFVGTATPYYVEEGHFYLESNNVKDGQINRNSEIFINDDFYERQKDNWLHTNDLVMVQSGHVGHAAVIPENLDNTAAHALIIIANPREKINPYFVNYQFQTKKAKHDIDNITIGNTIKHILSSEMKKFEISVCEYKEQNKIGDFFNNLDNLITLHQRKLEKMKALKKAYLTEMFPAEEERKPKLRFAGFTDDWEQRELGDLADIVRGASPRPIQDPKWFDDKSTVGWLRISDVSEQDGRIHYLEQHISKAGQEKTRVLIQSHLLLSIAASVGKPVINYVSTGVHDGFLIFQNPIFDQEFMFQWMKMFEDQWQKYGQPGSQVNLNSDIVKNQVILIPKKEEQVKIGTYFSQLDHLITLHHHKLEKLKNIKKAYLNEMFI